MLRHYDKLGLLKPAQTDPFTGYRLYSADQLPRLNRILALRDLGLSLEQISSLLGEDLSARDMLSMLAQKREEVERLIHAEQSRLERLDARIHDMNGSQAQYQYDVVLRAIEPQLVASLRKVAPDDDEIQRMFEHVERYVESFGARADRPPLSLYHDREYREADMDVEVAVPLEFAIAGNEEVRVYELAGIPEAACVIHTGGYASVYQAYNALLNWIEANAYRMSGPIREVYLRYGADGLEFALPPTYLVKGPAPFVTELQLAVLHI
jgi:effector-binding domain-containing protein